MVGLTPRAVRFYEERDLLPAPVRLESGFRLFSDDDVERLRLIRQLQEMLRFSLQAVREVIEAEEVRHDLKENLQRRLNGRAFEQDSKRHTCYRSTDRPYLSKRLPS